MLFIVLIYGLWTRGGGVNVCGMVSRIVNNIQMFLSYSYLDRCHTIVFSISFCRSLSVTPIFTQHGNQNNNELLPSDLASVLQILEMLI